MIMIVVTSYLPHQFFRDVALPPLALYDHFFCGSNLLLKGRMLPVCKLVSEVSASLHWPYHALSVVPSWRDHILCNLQLFRERHPALSMTFSWLRSRAGSFNDTSSLFSFLLEQLVRRVAVDNSSGQQQTVKKGIPSWFCLSPYDLSPFSIARISFSVLCNYLCLGFESNSPLTCRYSRLNELIRRVTNPCWSCNETEQRGQLKTKIGIWIWGSG